MTKERYNKKVAIPTFEPDGNLPPGIHFCTWSEFVDRFGTNLRRQRLISGLKLAMEQLKAAGCQIIYIDGSFVTNKPLPNDFDACWDEDGVDLNYLQTAAPALCSPQQSWEQKASYGGEFFRADSIVDESGTQVIDYFQVDSRTNIRKGIMAIDLVRWQ